MKNLTQYLLLMVVLLSAGVSYAQDTFTNPLLPTGPDPWITHINGHYYYMNTLGNRLKIWRTDEINNLANADTATVWTPPVEGPNSTLIWAPEIHLLDGKWYIYYTASDKADEGDHNRWVFVLENTNPDPLKGEWVDKGKVNTQYSGLDGSLFEHKGKRYFVYSAYIGPQSVLCIAEMKNPWTIKKKQVPLAYPEYEWEKMGGRQILEGPQYLEGPKDKMFLIYSASACWADEYSLGMLSAAKDSDPMNPASWKRSEKPVFKQSAENNVYATGHNSFFKSPDGTEDWILYHANTGANRGCGWERSPRAQKFTWDENGYPVFGVPVKPNVALPVPSKSI
ncbi:glycoside hydrolase family 43 protein [Limibacter armeniacum]|uniref:glycoside hydrolase family 43 protein n=1 Tax=Limibacter armeniacum TaxID=466084 RepID=UPI002FE6AFE9